MPVNTNTAIVMMWLTKRKAKSPALARRAYYLMRSLAVNYSRIANATLPSSQLRFTSEFGMGSGGSTALLPPGKKLSGTVFNAL